MSKYYHGAFSFVLTKRKATEQAHPQTFMSRPWHEDKLNSLLLRPLSISGNFFLVCFFPLGVFFSSCFIPLFFLVCVCPLHHKRKGQKYLGSRKMLGRSISTLAKRKDPHHSHSSQQWKLGRAAELTAGSFQHAQPAQGEVHGKSLPGCQHSHSWPSQYPSIPVASAPPGTLLLLVAFGTSAWSGRTSAPEQPQDIMHHLLKSTEAQHSEG